MKVLIQDVKTCLLRLRHRSRAHKEMIFIRLLILGTLISVSNYISAQDEKRSFDWDGYGKWENKTQYGRTYVVNQKHQNASDDNPGTADKPLQTINKAAQLAKAGERVLIYSGIYRKMIEPFNEGAGPGKMISYESAPGEQVIIKGSGILRTDWIQRRVRNSVLPDTSLTYTWSRRIWLSTLPDDFFINDYYPFKLPNIFPRNIN